MALKTAATWMGHPIVDPDHIHQLDRTAAAHELGGKDKLPKSEAEDKAYDEYVKDQRTDAAAWHLKGIKASQGAGDREAAKKHAIMYSLHVRALGHEPTGQPHPSIVARMEKHPDQLYKFKAHKGDLYALPGADKGPDESTKMDKSEHVGRHEIGHALLKMLESVLAKAEGTRLDGCSYCPGSPPKNREQAKRLKDTRQNRARETALYRRLGNEKASEPTKKSEGEKIADYVKARRVCRCNRYKFPHRFGAYAGSECK